jgi:hypothetical protein
MRKAPFQYMFIGMLVMKTMHAAGLDALLGNISAGRPSPVGMCTAPAGGSPSGVASDQCANAPAILSQGSVAQQAAGNPIQ